MSKELEKIRSMANKAAKEKIAQERDRVTKSAASDLAILEKILSMVKDRLIYKTVGDSWSKKYVVVTEEIVLGDYVNPPEYGHGTKITKVQGSYYSIPHTAIYVNGHRYHHAEDLFRLYEHELKQAMEKSQKERDIISEKQDALKAMKELEPVVKQILLDYQKHLEATNDPK